MSKAAGAILGLLLLAFTVGVVHEQVRRSQFANPFAIRESRMHGVSNSSSHGSALVPGGIYNQAALWEHAALYPGCDLSNAVFRQTTGTMIASVSYMENGKMYWTNRPRVIRAGEFVIQAGNCLILQRCGNLVQVGVSETLQMLPVTPGDVYPPEMVNGWPVPELRLERHGIPIADVVGGPGGPGAVSGTQPAPSGFIGPIPPVGPNIVNTPEPGTLFMLLAGLLEILIILPWMGRKL